jgi:hypothetical protein
MTTIDIYIGPSERRHFLKNKKEGESPYQTLRGTLENMLDNKFEHFHEFVKEVSLEQYWSALDRTEGDCDFRIKVPDGMGEITIEKINDMQGYCAKFNK